MSCSGKLSTLILFNKNSAMLATFDRALHCCSKYKSFCGHQRCGACCKHDGAHANGCNFGYTGSIRYILQIALLCL